MLPRAPVLQEILIFWIQKIKEWLFWPFQMRQTQRRRGSNTAWMYRTRVCSARRNRGKKVWVFDEGARSFFSHHMQAGYFIFHLKFSPPSGKRMHGDLTGIPERAVLVEFSQIRGKLIGSRVAPDKLDLLLITRRDISPPSNSSLLTARGRLWLSHMGHMKVRARKRSRNTHSASRVRALDYTPSPRLPRKKELSVE